MAVPDRGGTANHVRVNLRNTHPTLYWNITLFAVFSVAAALSYWFGPAPTFNPYGIDRNLVAALFFVYGTWQLLFLNIHYLLMVRIGLLFAFVLMGSWGVANTHQVFAGNASGFLPLLLGTCAGAHLKWLTESPVNPMTRRKS